MADSLTITLAGEPVTLLADRALYWPARRRLLIADLHLGKADVFRQAGIALPSGGTAADLARLARLIARCEAQALWILGDLLHGHLTDTAWRPAWDRFRAAHADLEIALVSGNHDRAVGRASLGITVLADEVEDGPFGFRHAPQTSGSALAGPRLAAPRFHIAGHLHPVVRVRGFPGRFPAFVERAQEMVLPAFSAFTGGWPMTGAALCHACVGGEILTMGDTAPGQRHG